MAAIAQPAPPSTRAVIGDGPTTAHGRQLFIVQLVFLVLAWIFMALRGYVRAAVVKKMGWDDGLMVVGVLMYTAYAIINLESIVDGGTAPNTSTITAAGAVISLRAWYLCEVIYYPMSGLIRTSIAAMLLRIATHKSHRVVVWANVAVIWTMAVAGFLALLLQCAPLDHFWKQLEGQQGACRDPNTAANAGISYAVIGAASDWVLGLLPMIMLWDVRLARRTKASVAVLLGLGIVAGIALVVRIPQIKGLPVSANFLYDTIDLAIWTVLEPSLGIIAGCAATLRPLFEKSGFAAPGSRKYVSSANSNTPSGFRASRSWSHMSSTPCCGKGKGVPAPPLPIQAPEASRRRSATEDSVMEDASSTAPIGLQDMNAGDGGLGVTRNGTSSTACGDTGGGNEGLWGDPWGAILLSGGVVHLRRDARKGADEWPSALVSP